MKKGNEPETMMINDVEYVRKSDVKTASVDNSNKDHPYKLGGMYCLRTVTMIETGRLIGVYDNELVLEDAAWIADTGRFNEFLKTGVAKEVEPFSSSVIVNRSSIIDATLLPQLMLDVK